MDDPNPNPAPNPSPAPAPAPAPAAVTRPEWLPESHWDGAANAIKPDFGTHYAELATFHKTESEKVAALKARKPEDIKFEIKLPDTVKVPDGMQIKIDENDPRVPILRQIAVEHGLDQTVVNQIVAIDAQQKIEAHNAEVKRVSDEDKALGSNAAVRKQAAGDWLKGLKDSGKMRPEVYERMRAYATDALTIEGIETLMQMTAGSVPGSHPANPPSPAQKSHADRIWPDGFSKKVS